jgi:hypothetical protein
MKSDSLGFPATLAIDYPDRELDRLTTFFRPFTVTPIAIVLGLVTRATVRADSANYVIGSGGIVFMATVLMLLFRQIPPLVVRLEPGSDEIRYPRLGLSGAAARRHFCRLADCSLTSQTHSLRTAEPANSGGRTPRTWSVARLLFYGACS